MKYKEFGVRSLLIGMIHNKRGNSKIIQDLVEGYKFDYYLIELNKDNLSFITKNNFSISEYYPILAGIERSKIILIDKTISNEISSYDNTTKNVIDSFLIYKLDKFLMYKLLNSKENYNQANVSVLLSKSKSMSKIYNSHIIQREEYMLSRISDLVKFNHSRNLFVLVGINHYDFISSHLTWFD